MQKFMKECIKTYTQKSEEHTEKHELFKELTYWNPNMLQVVTPLKCGKCVPNLEVVTAQEASRERLPVGVKVSPRFSAVQLTMMAG